MSGAIGEAGAVPQGLILNKKDQAQVHPPPLQTTDSTGNMVSPC